MFYPSVCLPAYSYTQMNDNLPDVRFLTTQSPFIAQVILMM